MTEPIRKGMLVTISLVMADMTGTTLDETPPEGMVYLHGQGDIFPKLEAALEGRFAGEGFSIHLEPEEAFGEYDAEAIRLVPIDNFARTEGLEPGTVVDEVPGEAQDGRTWRVTDVADGSVILEANHPLAGVGLQFAVRVLDVHEPSAEELESMEDDGTESLVPPFLRLADRIVSEDDEDDTPYEAADGDAGFEDDGSSMAKLARPPRIVR